jgi:hypothetical protein
MSAGNRIRRQRQGHALVAVILRGPALSFLDQLSSCFDPVVVRVALQRKLEPSLRDKICANPNFLIGGFVDRRRRRSVLRNGRLSRTNDFLLRRWFFPLGLRSCVSGSRFRRCTGAHSMRRRFRPLAVGSLFRLDFGFSDHVWLSPIESQIY